MRRNDGYFVQSKKKYALANGANHHLFFAYSALFAVKKRELTAKDNYMPLRLPSLFDTVIQGGIFLFNLFREVCPEIL